MCPQVLWCNAIVSESGKSTATLRAVPSARNWTTASTLRPPPANWNWLAPENAAVSPAPAASPSASETHEQATRHAIFRKNRVPPQTIPFFLFVFGRLQPYFGHFGAKRKATHIRCKSLIFYILQTGLYNFVIQSVILYSCHFRVCS